MRNVYRCVLLVALYGVALPALSESSDPQATKLIQNLEELRQIRREQVRNMYLQPNSDEQLELLKNAMLRLVDGNASATDISKITDIVLQKLKAEDPEVIMTANILAELTYVFAGDIQAARIFTKATGTPFKFVNHFFHSTTMNEKFVRDITDSRLTDYIIDWLIDDLIKATGDFYSEGKYGARPVPWSTLLVLPKLPWTDRTEIFLLNFPFEIHGWVWRNYLEREEGKDVLRFPIPDAPKIENTLEWYYNDIISETKLKNQFREMLKKRDISVPGLPPFDAEEEGKELE